jgi:dienelactone hydrolase
MSTLAEQPKTMTVRIPIDERTRIDADVSIPAGAKGMVLFAHGSGSSRHSPRNRYVASELNSVPVVTVLADLLTEKEERLDQQTSAFRFNIPMLTARLVHMIDWARSYNLIATLPIGLFGASTGAAAALDAAAARPDFVRAVVSRGGRPDLASRLSEVKSPTLLIVGGNDPAVLQMNHDALRMLTCPKTLQVVPRATHLFQEPGALESVAAAAGAWFEKYLRPVPWSVR